MNNFGSDLTIIVPCFNEEAGIAKVLLRLQQCDDLKNATVLVVNDGSTDGTFEQIRSFDRVKCLTHAKNRGYGGSIKSGVRQARSMYVAWYDGDGQHKTEDLVKLYKTICDRNLDAVLGERAKGSHLVISRLPGKMVLSLFTTTVLNKTFRDLNCGLRVFKRSVLRDILCLLPNGFSASSTTTVLMDKLGYDYQFVPVTTERRVGKSQVRQLRDGSQVLAMIVRMTFLFGAYRIFSVLALSLFFGGSIYGGVLSFMTGRGFPVLAGALVILGVLFFCLGTICDQITLLRLEQIERLRFLDSSE